MPKPAESEPKKPIVLHIGDPIKYNHEQYARFSSDFAVIRPSLEERQRDEFMTALKERRWGDFSAIYRPFWGTGGEMGRWDKELVPLLPDSVRIFASAGAGFDWADVDVLAQHGIVYCNSATASTEAVADYAIFAILSTFRCIRWAITAAVSQSTADFKDCHDRATSLSSNPRGHVLGIIGLGKIGYAIAKTAYSAFGMKIIYYDVLRKERDVEDSVQALYYKELSEMLAEADCVVLATPSSADGSKMIDAATLASCKQNSRFINIARGSLVDEEALADSLDSGRLSAAMLDVHEFEPKVNARLAKMSNVTLTCHNAGGTIDTHHGFERLSMENIDAVLKGREPISPVNMQLINRDHIE